MTPLTKPFAKWSDGKLTIEPNPFQDISDYQKLLADEAPALARLRELDYITWSDQQGSTNPSSAPWTTSGRSGNVDPNLGLLLNQDRDERPSLSDLKMIPTGGPLASREPRLQGQRGCLRPLPPGRPRRRTRAR